MPQPEKVLDPTRSPAEWFGNELRLRRKAAGFPKAAPFASKVQVSVDVLLKIEKGNYRCPQDLPPRLDAALDTGGLFTRAWAMVFGDADKRSCDADKRSPRPSEDAVPQLERPILGAGAPTSSIRSPDPVHRRNILAIGSLLALAPLDLSALLGPATTPSAPSKIRPKEIRELRETSQLVYIPGTTRTAGAA
ncbi:hypothetical protein [Streptomyces sp. NPDC005435]|uniref:hypothetical protein n=1 Tax=Streptomyces sp. NPDC005435 TaxID=3154464 RepID=UPI0034569F8A